MVKYPKLSLGDQELWIHVNCPECGESGGLRNDPENGHKFGIRECDFCGSIYDISHGVW